MDYEKYYYQNRGGSKLSSSGSGGDEESRPRWYTSIYAKASLFLAALLTVVVILSNREASTDEFSSRRSSSRMSSVMRDLNFAATLKITSPGYDDIDTSNMPWTLIAEPAKMQVISLQSVTLNGEALKLDDSVVDVKWSIDGKVYSGISTEFKLPANYFGTSLKFSVSIGAKSGKLLAKGVDSSYSFTHSDTMVVKYIRREIRQLTDTDRTAFFKALQAMYSVSEEDGQKQYGAKFHNIEYYLWKHLTGAGKTDCDHWHDGAGILTHHAAFTLEVEQTLQAVDPSVAMPYWEYGMDAYLYSTLADSPIFGKDWFGEMSPSSDDHGIDDGSFWANVKVIDGAKYSDWSVADTGSLNPYVNALGAMRSPWNNNPSTKIGRRDTTYGKSQYSAVPSCSELRACFQSESLADMNYCSNGNTHGPVHIMIGGAWGDDDIFSAGDLGYVQNPDKVLFFKVLWRMGLTRCPSSCTSTDDCACAVPQEYIDKYGAKEILKMSNIYYALESVLSKKTDAQLLKVLRAVEDPGIAGEMFTSAAPFDPTFWPLHGSMERLVSYKRALIAQGSDKVGAFDETWGYPEYDRTDGAAYLNGVCDWSSVKDASDTSALPTCSDSSDCSGHAEDDTLEFGNFLNKGETYTNADFYAFLHPWNEELPYLYDTLTFDYCTEHGYDFLDTSSSAKAKDKQEMEMKRRQSKPSAM